MSTDRELKAGQFRKKPVVIEAMRFERLRDLERNFWGDYASAKQIERWSNGEVYPAEYNPKDGWCSRLTVRTLEGAMSAEPGDWIIRGVKGEFYPCKPDIFEQTYEPATRPLLPEGGVREELRKELERRKRLTHGRLMEMKPGSRQALIQAGMEDGIDIALSLLPQQEGTQ